MKSTDGHDVSLGYCPLDLFSGDELRVKKAIHSLWDAWIGSSGQVNNLRVFVGGTMLKPSLLVSPQFSVCQSHRSAGFHYLACQPRTVSYAPARPS